MKPVLAYINPDCYVDVDIAVLRHLVREYHVIWYPVYFTDRPIYYTPQQMERYARENGIELHLTPRLFRQRDPRNLRVYSQIVKELNQRRVDIVYSCISEELYWTLATLGLNVRWVLGLHDVVMHRFDAPFKRFIQTCIRELTIRTSRHVCVFSANQSALFRKRYRRTAGVLGLSCRNLGPLKTSPPPISEGFRLLFFGNIVQYKGLDLLMEAMERLRARGIDNLSLTIAGRGEYWEKCKGLVKTPKMFHLEIRFIDNEEIPALLGSHHFLALPYRDATQSGPLAIAAGYGKPILAPDYGCFREQYSRQSALLYSNLEDALLQLSSLTEQDYEGLCHHAERLKEVFSEEAVARRYIQYFKSL